MNCKTHSLGDYILDRTESLTDDLIQEYFVEQNTDKINRLLDSEQYLLEGSRGAGKTMLLKKAMLQSRLTFNTNSALTVWVSFEESLRLENIKIVQNTVDPFLQWTMGKILKELLQELKYLKPASMEDLEKRLSNLFGTSVTQKYDSYFKLLDEYITILETGDIQTSEDLEAQCPSKELSKILDNPANFKNFIKQIITDFSLSRIVLLFDEALMFFHKVNKQNFLHCLKV